MDMDAGGSAATVRRWLDAPGFRKGRPPSCSRSWPCARFLGRRSVHDLDRRADRRMISAACLRSGSMSRSTVATTEACDLPKARFQAELLRVADPVRPEVEHLTCANFFCTLRPWQIRLDIFSASPPG